VREGGGTDESGSSSCVRLVAENSPWLVPLPGRDFDPFFCTYLYSKHGTIDVTFNERIRAKVDSNPTSLISASEKARETPQPATLARMAQGPAASLSQRENPPPRIYHRDEKVHLRVDHV